MEELPTVPLLSPTVSESSTKHVTTPNPLPMPVSAPLDERTSFLGRSKDGIKKEESGSMEEI